MLRLLILCAILSVEGGLLRGITNDNNLVSSNNDDNQGQATTTSVMTMPLHADNDDGNTEYPARRRRRNLDTSSCLLNTTACPACHNLGTCCMADNYNIYNQHTLTPPSNDDEILHCNNTNLLSFQDVTNLQVRDNNNDDVQVCNCNGVIDNGRGVGPSCSHPPQPKEVNCNGKPLGTIYGACLGGSADYITVRFTITMQVDTTTAQQYYNDVGLYVATNGEDAISGTSCNIVGLLPNNSTSSSYDGNSSSANSNCHNILHNKETTTLMNYTFDWIKLKCVDGIGNMNDKDGLLDFSVAASYKERAGKLQSICFILLPNPPYEQYLTPTPSSC